MAALTISTPRHSIRAQIAGRVLLALGATLGAQEGFGPKDTRAQEPSRSADKGATPPPPSPDPNAPRRDRSADLTPLTNAPEQLRKGVDTFSGALLRVGASIGFGDMKDTLSSIGKLEPGDARAQLVKELQQLAPEFDVAKGVKVKTQSGIAIMTGLSRSGEQIEEYHAPSEVISRSLLRDFCDFCIKVEKLPGTPKGFYSAAVASLQVTLDDAATKVAMKDANNKVTWVEQSQVPSRLLGGFKLVPDPELKPPIIQSVRGEPISKYSAQPEIEKNEGVQAGRQQVQVVLPRNIEELRALCMAANPGIWAHRNEYVGTVKQQICQNYANNLFRVGQNGGNGPILNIRQLANFWQTPLGPTGHTFCAVEFAGRDGKGGDWRIIEAEGKIQDVTHLAGTGIYRYPHNVIKDRNARPSTILPSHNEGMPLRSWTPREDAVVRTVTIGGSAVNKPDREENKYPGVALTPLEDAFIEKFNKWRRDHRLPEVEPDERYMKAARLHAKAMKSVGVMAHDLRRYGASYPTLNSRAAAVGLPGFGECAAMAPGASNAAPANVAQFLLRQWDNSPPHKAIMSRTSGAGRQQDGSSGKVKIGFSVEGDYASLVVQ